MDKSIRLIIAKNISGLRKREHMTQAELAEKLYYSDKAVSKWERAESLPDAEMLYQIAQIFQVEIQYLFTEHEDLGFTIEEQNRLKKKEAGYRCLFIISVVIILFTMFLTILIGTMDYLGASNSSIFLFFLPLIPTVLLIVNLIMGRKRLNLVFVSLIIWTIAEAFYVYFSKFNLTILFAIALVLEIAILLWPRYNQYIVKKTKGNNKK